MENRPEQVEQVEVVGKRTSKSSYGTHRGIYRGTLYYPYITFEFPDGTVEELPAGRPDQLEFYDAIQEGDTGKLTYKVDKNNGRGRLVSFEKDAKYGGFILEPYRQGDKVERIKVYVLAIPLFIALLFFTLLFILGAKLEVLKKNMIRKTEQQAKVIKKRLAIFAFEIPDGSVIELHDPSARLKINDTGTLIYEEIENIEKHIKHEKSRWRGREFIRLKKHK